MDTGFEFDPGLPHGRLWVAEKGCDCELCVEARRLNAHAVDARARVEESAARPWAGTNRRAPRPARRQLTWTKHGDRWVVVGPVELMHVGTVKVRNMTTGRVRRAVIQRLGAPFVVDGVEVVYGYLR